MGGPVLVIWAMIRCVKQVTEFPTAILALLSALALMAVLTSGGNLALSHEVV